ncbi:hypothetical protein QBC43DRAFT_258704 [Cladorrhinum sp. PSN259]|nr:hypothetical protein QBC43DRAFT_258704 [Cladorrhinum sp. PSN259]
MYNPYAAYDSTDSSSDSDSDDQKEKERSYIVSRDPTDPIDEKVLPLISDILRMRYVLPESVFLVEGIEKAIPVADSEEESDGKKKMESSRKRRRIKNKKKKKKKRGKRMVRIILGDGEYAMQGVLKPDAHWLVDKDLVWEGCYVRCDKIEYREIEFEGEKGIKGGKKGREVYLLISDMVTVGWNKEYLRILGVEEPGPDGKWSGRAKGKGKEVVVEEESEEEPEEEEALEGAEEDEEEQLPQEEEEDEEVIIPSSPPSVQNPRAPPSAQKPPRFEVEDSEEDYISDWDDEAFEALTEQALARRATLAAQQPHPNLPLRSTPPQQGPSQGLPDASPGQVQNQEPPVEQPPPQQHQQPPDQPEEQYPAPPPWMAQDPALPVKLTPLSKIPNLPYSQNWMCNVLAVVTFLGEVEPCRIAPYVQRTARLADMSTSKQVHLTVFLEPHKFTPRVGSVVLLVGVKNHRFDGGSLKKYVSDRLKSGKVWWVQDPGALGWCEEEVAKLEGWWGARKW